MHPIFINEENKVTCSCCLFAEYPSGDKFVEGNTFVHPAADTPEVIKWDKVSAEKGGLPDFFSKAIGGCKNAGMRIEITDDVPRGWDALLMS